MLQWLLTPSDFEGDPLGFAGNQLGHLALGAGLAWLIGWPLALLACLAWEAVHLWRGGSWWDSAEDYGFVAAGVVAVAVSPIALAVAVPFLAAGILRRAE